MKKVLSLILALCLCLSLLPAAALAADGVPYYDPTQSAGNETQDCATYTEATSETKTWSAGWYVVNHNVTIDGTLTFTGDVYLILCDGATLRVTDGIDGSGSSLTIYAGNTTGSAIQGTGKLTVTGAAGDDYEVMGVELLSLTVNGGEVTVDTTGKTAKNRYGLYLNGNLIVCGGKLTATSGTVTVRTDGDVSGSSYGAYIHGNVEVSGNGALTATGGDVNLNGKRESSVTGESYGASISGNVKVSGNGTLTVTGGEVNVSGESENDSVSGKSYGAVINNGKVEMSDNGKLTATGDAVTVSGKARSGRDVKGESYGLYIIDSAPSTISGGTLKATASDVSVARTDGSGSYVKSKSVGIYRNYFNMTISGGVVELAHGTATLTGSENGKTSAYDYCMDTDQKYTLTVSGGTMKLRESFITTTITAADPVKLADLLAEGYAYWQVSWPDKYSEETDIGFVKLTDDLTTLSGDGYNYYIKRCTHSADTGICEYCGKNLDIREDDALAWLTPVLGALDKEPFDDVKSGDWFYDDVHYVNDYELMTGTASRTFSPDAPVTRGMVMTILARRDGIKTDRYSPWYAAGVEWAVVNGISDGSNPEAEITREELATMLYRYAKLKGYDVSVGADTNILSFLDALEISDYAFEPLQWAVGSGLMNGSSGKLTPRDTATRAQLAAMLHRFFG